MVALSLLFTKSIIYAEDSGYIIRFTESPMMTMSAESELVPIIPEENLYLVNSKETAMLYYESGMLEYFEPDYLLTAHTLPTDYLYSYQWDSQIINADSSWEIETYGNEIKVAVIDTGCYSHNDIKDNLLTGYNYLNNSTNTTDTSGHGTHVSGIIAAMMNDTGICGIAPKAKIVPLKVMETKTTSSSFVIRAIRDAVDVFGCKVINMSLGAVIDVENGEEYPKALEDAVNYAVEKDAIVIASAGNEGIDGLPYSYPAAFENVISVGAVDHNKQKADFSNNNDKVLIFAPGVSILSTYTDNGYAFSTGTSMSAPMVSAACAIALSIDDSLTQKSFESLLINTAQEMRNKTDDIYGYGILDIQAMIKKLLSEKRFYMSPVNITEDGSYVMLVSNYSRPVSAYSVCAVYNNNKYLASDTKPTYLLPGKKVIIKQNVTNNVKYFFWSNLNTMIPLCESREYFK